MIEVVRPCYSPACRGEPYKQRISCDIHPDTVDCTATCAERLASSRSRCLFCGEWNGTEPVEGNPFRMEGLAEAPSRRRERTGEKRSYQGRKGRRGRPGRKRRKKGYPGRFRG